MVKTVIVTDSNSGITQEEAKELGIHVIPMPFYINGQLYYEDITLSQEEFYQKLSEDADITTSQPAPADVLELWEELLKEYEEIVHIPMSSGLSSSCETAIVLAEEFDGRVKVVDNQRISVTQRQSVLDALQMSLRGMSASEIEEILVAEKLESSIYVMVDTLKYLKKGGRITPAAAAVGSVLNLKPVLQIQGDKLDAFAKVRGIKAAKKTLIKAMAEDVVHRFKGEKVFLQAAYTCSEEAAKVWKDELSMTFPNHNVHMDKLSLSIACHIGPGAIAIACSKKIVL